MSSRSSRLVIVYALLLQSAAMCCGAAEVPAEKKSQPDVAPPVEAWPIGRTVFAQTALEKRVRAALAEPFAHELKNVTLAELAKFLEERLKCTVAVDEPALTSGDDKVDRLDLQLRYSLRPNRGSLQDELNRLPKFGFRLSQRIVFLLRNECLWITSQNSAEAKAALRVYQVHDLVVEADGRTITRRNLEQLGDLIQTSCAEGWRNGGGVYATVEPFEGAGILALAVVQTDEGHEQVERFLTQLRSARLEELRRYQAAGKPQLLINRQVGPLPQPWRPLPPPPRMPRGKVIESRTKVEQKIRDSLRGPTKLDFTDMPLDEIAGELATRFGFNVWVDNTALTADGKERDMKLSLHWLDGELGNALSLMLEQHGLAYVVRNDALVITTATGAESVTRTVLYQIHDLISRDAGLNGRRADFETYKQIITSIVAPESWGDGWDVRGYEAAGLQVLVVNQGERIHPQLAAFLDLLREAYEPKVYDAQRLRAALPPPPAPQPEPQPQPKSAPQQPAVRSSGGNFFNVSPSRS